MSTPPCAGVLFEQDDDNFVRVAEVLPGSQAAASGLVFVGDRLVETSAVFGDALWSVSDFKRTMSAIHQRQGDLMLVLERFPRRAADKTRGASRKGASSAVNPDATSSRASDGDGCESFSGGKVGVTWATNGRSGMLLASFSLSEGCIVDSFASASPPAQQHRQPAAATQKSRPSQSSATMDALLNNTVALPDNVAAAEELRAALNACVCSHPRMYTLSVPVTPRGLALLCMDYNIGGIVALQQPFEAGRDAALAQAAAAAAGTRRITVPIADATRHDLCAALHVAAGAVSRLADWVGPSRGVLVTACDPDGLLAPTVAAACMHWHWGMHVDDIEEAVLTADVSIIDAAGEHMLVADSAKSSVVRGDSVAGLMAFPRVLGPSPPTVELFETTFTWHTGGKPTQSVMLVGEPVGTWAHTGAMALNKPAPRGASGTTAVAEDWTLRLVLPRGSYAFKFVVDGLWVSSKTHSSAGDEKGNVNNVLHVRAPGSGHTPVRGDAALQWGASPLRMALVRGCASHVALALDETTLLPPGSDVPGSVRTTLAELRAQHLKMSGANRSGGSPQILR